MVKIGMFLGGRYEILEKIGSGGMSDVYRAKDHKLNRDVAVKVLKQEFNSDKSFIGKFRTEAHAAACLSHPNIVHVFDVGDEADLHYIVMELVEGITLKTYIAKKGKLEIRETIGIAMQVAQGIEAAHEQHIVHRDIKPQNIIISRDGKVKVTDFGIAKAATSETITSNTMGSVHYISPEQARGGYCDERSDIYSLGITMYEMLTGRVPFEGDSPVSVALLHIRGEMVPPRQYEPMIPVSLEKIVMKCTQKKPEMRYRSVTELIADLKRALMSPNEDFVKMNAISSDGPTRVMSEEEVERIRNGAAEEDLDATEVLEPYDGYDDEEEERYQLDYDDEDLLSDDDEDYDDEEEGGRKSDKVFTIVGIVVAVVIVLLALFVVGRTFGWFNFSGNRDRNNGVTESDGTEVEMPNLLGKTVEEAEELMAEADLEMVLSYAESDEYEEDQIMEQEYEAGEMVLRHTVVRVTVSKGTTVTTVPDDLIGMTREEVTRALHAADLNPEFDEIYSDSQPEGRVAQVRPGLGVEVEIGSTVTVYISLGPETRTTRVPSVLGYTEADARSELEAAGLTVGSVTTGNSDEYAEGQVMSQSISGGSTVEEGSVVDLVISQGPAVTTVRMPYVLEMSAEDAADTLTSNGLAVGTIHTGYSNLDAGLVYSASYSAGTELESGTTVELWVSLGPEPTEPPATEPPAEPTTPPTESEDPPEATEPSSDSGAAQSQ